MFSDLRHVFRSLAKSPGYLTVAVLIVAIGIGAATAMFSTVNALVLRPIPVPEPERLVAVYENNLPRNISIFSVSIPNYVDWKARSTSWESLAAVGSRARNVTGAGEPELAQVLHATANFIPTIGIPLVLGRNFTPEEDRPGHARVALLTEAYWKTRYAASPDILGETLTLDGIPHTIVGVVAPSPLFQSWDKILVPLAPNAAADDRLDHDISVFGRLKPGITLAQADAEMKAVAAQTWSELPDAERGWSTFLVPLADELVGPRIREGLYLLLASVGLLLLIACANLSNLMLVRATARTHELAIRTALGAARWHIVRQLLAESLVVTIAGGLGGIVLTLWATDFLRTLPLPRATEISVDFRVLFVCAAASLLTGLLAGVGPAFHASRSQPQHALKGRAPLSGGRSRLRDTLVVAQLALSLTLLVSAALVVRSFVRLTQVDPGFTTDGVLSVSLRPHTSNAAAFYEQVIQRVSAFPDVASAGLITRLPLTPGGTSLNVYPLGPSPVPAGESVQANWRLVHGSYFATLQIPLLRGRTFETLPPDEAAGSIVLSQRLAHVLFGDADPIGRHVTLGTGSNYVTVVGVVGDVRSHRLSIEPTPSYYLSVHRFTYGPMALVVRTSGDTAPLVAALRETIRAIDPTVPLFGVQSMNEVRAESLQQERFVIALLGGFALVALLLAALGTYGVVAFGVHQRTSEFGLRIAIGAQTRDILHLVLGQGLRLAAVGIALGLAGALAASRALDSLLYATAPTDLLSYSVASLSLAVAGLAASFLPACRATRVDPLTALRAE